MVEYLSVEDDSNVSIAALHGLITGLQIEDPQSGSAERYLFRYKMSLMVGPAVHDRLQG